MSTSLSITLMILAAVVAAAVTWLLTRQHERQETIRLSTLLDAEKLLHQQEKLASQQRLDEQKAHYEELKAAQEKSLEAAKSQLIIENEKTLKAREEALKKEAAETMKGLTAGLDQQIKSMKEAFEAQKKTQTEESASIKTRFEETVKSLRQQTEAIGSQAVDLAKALRGKNKMQGIFGEMTLENLLQQENLEKGRDYDTEFWLRDKKGRLLENEETGRRMRPDVALHFPDGTDILIDAKVSLSALQDYFSAETDEARADALARNLASVRDHVRELTSKEYQKYVEGRRTLEYVIMFIPNYGAYQLA